MINQQTWAEYSQAPIYFNKYTLQQKTTHAWYFSTGVVKSGLKVLISREVEENITEAFM